jgi:hypothetical protein
MAIRNEQRSALDMGSINRGHCCVCQSLLTFTATDALVTCITCRSTMNHVSTSTPPFVAKALPLLFHPHTSFIIQLEQTNPCIMIQRLCYILPSCFSSLLQRTCPNCTTSLIFPFQVQNVQCGRCGFNTVFPPANLQRRHHAQEPSRRLLTCVSCRTTISFPCDAPAVK